jgi:hypothetical protein
MVLTIAMTFEGCAGSGSTNSNSKVYAPENMPEICQDIDFNHSGADLKKLCGVQTRNYKAYRNIPEHRNLLLPKGGKLVKKGSVLELRLENTLPIELPPDLAGKILFDEKFRRILIKSKMDYCEFFPEKSSERIRIFSLQIPLDLGGERNLCYSVESRLSNGQRKFGYAGRLEVLNCDDFIRLKRLSQGDSTDASDSSGAPAKVQNVMEGVKKP